MRSIRSSSAGRPSNTGRKRWIDFCRNAIGWSPVASATWPIVISVAIPSLPPPAPRIYDHLGWSLTREAEQRMRVVLANQPQEQHGFHRYNLSQFGLQAAEGERAFAPYCERFGLSTQAAGRARSPGSSARVITEPLKGVRRGRTPLQDCVSQNGAGGRLAT